jgi:hypothetical protein
MGQIMRKKTAMPKEEQIDERSLPVTLRCFRSEALGVTQCIHDPYADMRMNFFAQNIFDLPSSNRRA